MEPFQQFFGMGLGDLAEHQSNTIELSLSTGNTISDMVGQLDHNERLLSVILSSMRAEFKATLNKKLGEKVKEIVANFDPDFANSPPLVFL
jgi:hypothetical protein